MSTENIVVVIGLKGPFDRLIRAAAAWKAAAPDRNGWVQYGESVLPAGLDGAAIVPRNELLSRMRAADAVVTHGGSGAIRDALACGHAPVVVARRHDLGEHVNDHQAEIVAALARHIVPCPRPEDATAFTTAIAEAMTRRTSPTELPGGDELRAAVGARLAVVTQAPSRRAQRVWDILAAITRGVDPRRRDIGGGGH